MKTPTKLFCGFVLGWLIYMFLMAATVYDGVPSLIFQPLIAAVFSGFFVAAALVVGLVLRAPKIREAWSSAGRWVLLITVAALSVIIFSAQLGLETEYVDPDTSDDVKAISPTAALICYFLAVFPIVNLPGKKKPNDWLQA
jgi:hypothetical protein